MKSVIFLITWISLTTLSLSVLANDPTVRKKINVSTARTLVAQAKFGFVSEKYVSYFDGPNGKMSPPFFVYDGLGPAGGSFGFFAVNPWTGDVWALWGCHKISTPASLETQAKIKQRFTAKELGRYDELSNLKPDCVVDDSQKE